MADIFHNFPVNAPAAAVFHCLTTAEGLNRWWTKTAESEAKPGGVYKLGFGPNHQWVAVATRHKPSEEFELQLKEADADWKGTKVGFVLKETNAITDLSFYHIGWPAANGHFKISSFCWAMYLRLLKRYMEYGEEVPYEDRLSV